MRASDLNNLAVSYYNQGQEEAAVRCWQEALNCYPDHLESNLNWLYYQWSKEMIGVDEFVSHLDMLAQRKPYEKNAEFWYLKFVAEREMGFPLVFRGRLLESAVRALLYGSKADIIARADQKLKEEIRKWSHPGAGGVMETGIMIIGELLRESEALRSNTYTLGEDIVYALFFLDDLILVDNEGYLKIWKDTQMETLEKFGEKFSSLVTGGDNLLIISMENIAFLFDIKTRRILHVFDLQKSEKFVFISSDGSVGTSVYTEIIDHGFSDFGIHMVSKGKSTVKLWDLTRGKIISAVELSKDEELVAVSPDGARFVTKVSETYFLRKMDSIDRIPLESRVFLKLCTFVSCENIVGVCFPPYPPSVLELVSWKITGPTMEKTIKSFYFLEKEKLPPIEIIGVDQTGRYVFILSKPSTIQQWDVEKGLMVRMYFHPIIDEIWSKKMLRREVRVRINRQKSIELLYKDEGGWKLTTIEAPAQSFPFPLATSKCETVSDRHIKEMLALAKEKIAEQKHREAYVLLRDVEITYPEISGQKDYLDLLYLCGKRGSQKNLKTYLLRRRFVAHNWVVSCFSFSSNGFFASGSWDRTIKLWKIMPNYDVVCVKVFEGHFSGINVLCFSKDGRYLLSGSDDRTIILWDVNKGSMLQTFRGHTQGISCISFSPNEILFASGSWDGTVRVWNINSGLCVRVLDTHGGKVASVFFIDESTVFLTNSIRIRWNIRTNKSELYRGSPTFEPGWRKEIEIGGKIIHPPHTGRVEAFAISKDRRFLVTGSNDQTICLFELDWEWEFPDSADWDEGARPYLESFLLMHTPYDSDGFTKVGEPQWTEEDFQKLIEELSNCGYGWLRPEGIRHELKK